MLLYSVLGAVQGMAYTYLSSVLTTIERQFGIKSQEAAWIFSGNEVSQIAFIFVLPFLTRLQKRIMWTSVALIVSAVSKATISIQYLHIIYTISTICTISRWESSCVRCPTWCGTRLSTRAAGRHSQGRTINYLTHHHMIQREL